MQAAQQNIADVCKELDEVKPNGCKMTYISTDYVFDGQGTQHDGSPDCKDYAPQNVYGQTKLDGELAVSRHCGEILHRPYCMGIWSEWQELYPYHGKSGKNP